MIFLKSVIFISELKAEIYKKVRIMAQMLRNTFIQKHDSDKNYRGWACVGTPVRFAESLARGGIELREVDE